MTTVALIPARGGSKGIPGKNIKPMLGRPLLHWSLRAATGCTLIDRVYVSTDDEAIAAAARSFPGVEVLPRAPETATDTASTESVMLDAIGRMPSFQDLVLIQATSPLLGAADLRRGLERRRELGADSCLSVVRQKRFLWRDERGLGQPVNYDFAKRPRRQEFDGHLVENGAFYVNSRERILASKCRLGGKVALCEMDEDTYQEIDEEIDWTVAEAFLRARLAKRGAAIKLLAFDVDGTLTDGGMYYGADGEALKRFDTRDAFGMDGLRREHGVVLGAITKEDSPATRARCKKLGIELQAHGCLDKAAVLREWCVKLGIDLERAAFMGDDLNDLAPLRLAGYSATPADGARACREAADFTCSKPAGHGAMREFVDHLAALKRAAVVRPGGAHKVAGS